MSAVVLQAYLPDCSLVCEFKVRVTFQGNFCDLYFGWKAQGLEPGYHLDRENWETNKRLLSCTLYQIYLLSLKYKAVCFFSYSTSISDPIFFQGIIDHFVKYA